jgi:hypothetical protein
MTYKVIKDFVDMQDNNKVYRVGDEYPVRGKTVSESRIKSLLTGVNALGMICIAEVEKRAENAEKQAETKPADKKPKTTARTSRRTK